HALAFPRRISPEFCSVVALPEIREGAGNAGCWLHPWPPREKLAQKRALTDRYSRDNPAFPAQWFTAYFALSSVSRTLLSPSPARCACIVANLAPATGRQDHTTSPSASASSVFDASASTASRLTFRDDRDTPLFNRGGMEGESSISEKRKANYFHRALLNALTCLDSARQISVCAQVIWCG